MSSIPSPISAFKNWKEYEPNPPNIGVNTINNSEIIHSIPIRPIPIRRKRKYGEITPNQMAMYPSITISDSDNDSNNSDNESALIIVG
tara:strand:- start:427 stop:690 length:264 start_codon:yes stop_codon:yes gene_type:complete